MNHEQAAALWTYDASTGVLRWKAAPGHRVKAGDIAGSVNGDGYAQVGHAGRPYKVHRIAWLLHFGHWPQHEIDHVNGHRSDNRIANLRDVPHRVNQGNQKYHRAGVDRKGRAVTSIGAKP